ncbi:glycosyltransferase family protein [Rhodobacter lacus]
MNSQRLENARILMYSHDTFGLGHLSRCRAIANALVETYRGLSVMIISGATIAGAFDYRVRVDFVKVPSVIKLHNGEYQSMAAHTSLTDTLAMRRAIIRHTAESFRPDIFITDKEPMGLHGEVEETLAYLKARGTRLVLGLREIMDSPELLASEWAGKEMMEKIEAYYDAIWVYGPEGFNDPLSGLDVPETVRARMHYTGFLRRSRPRSEAIQPRPAEGYLLVTTGGGGDGAALVEAVLAAHEHARTTPEEAAVPRTLVVFGPYLPPRERTDFIARARALPNVEIIEFDNRMEDLVAGARCVVAMGGYNTFCEILSFDKPALIVPRTTPRLEQALRAERGQEFGLVRMMPAEDITDTPRFAGALRALCDAPPPSQTVDARMRSVLEMNGLETVSADVGEWIFSAARPAPPPRPAHREPAPEIRLGS